jgi:hypothetical protein
MTYEDHLYHTERERQCRLLAEGSSDPDIRRRHFELAELHAGRAAAYMPAPIPAVSSRLSAVQ